MSKGILVICSDRVGERMAGPGIRAYELARALARHGEVTLAAVLSDDAPPSDIDVLAYDRLAPRALRPAIAAADVIVAQPHWPHVAAWLRSADARLIYDLYDPEPLEVLEQMRDRRMALRRMVGTLTSDRYVGALRHGDHFVCASEKQRDFWLGLFAAEGQLTPALYDQDPGLRSIIDVVPFGLPSERPTASNGGGPRARFPQIDDGDEIVLWNGGIWNWLDAPTAVRAVARLRDRRPSARLVFMGAVANVASRAATERTRRVAAELGLLDDVVLFNDTWTPYEQRGAWLMQANCAISTHLEHLETRFAFRTRLLDCFWAGLPVVCTRGDDLAELVDREELGATVPEGDVDAVAAALERVLERGRHAYQDALSAAAAAHTWKRVAEPLVRYATGPTPIPREGRRPAGVTARDGGFRAAAAVLNGLGLPWPRL
jgi:glycosyltransferase involved in cell wall biosynthesis